jgi:hypothetical protein
MSSDTNEKTDFNFFEKEEIEKMILAPTEERKTFTYNVEYTNPLLEKTTNHEYIIINIIYGKNY